MKQTSENIAWMTRKLALFSHYPNFPKTDDALEETAKRVLKFVHNRPKCDILRDAQPPDMRTLYPVNATNTENDVDFLFDWISEQRKFFPVILEMRQFYQQSLPPADGKEVALPVAYEGADE
jgi:hypothetical protein